MNNSNVIKVMNENGKVFEYGQIPDLWTIAEGLRTLKGGQWINPDLAADKVLEVWHMAHHLKAAIENQEGIAKVIEPAEFNRDAALPNGALIHAIDYRRNIVLAHSGTDWVTWAFNEGDLSSTHTGHYFGDDESEAREDFCERVKRGY